MNKLLATAAAAALLGCSTASFATPAWTVPSDNGGSTNGSWSFGQLFTVGSSNIVVSALGAYDQNLNGFATVGGIPLALFRESDGMLLASATATNASTLDGFFRYTNITATTLMAGQTYRIVGASGADRYRTSSASSVSPLITLGNFEYCSGTQAIRCNDFSGPNVVWMANMQIDAAPASVPEPAMLGLFGLGALGLGLKRRKA